MPRLAALLLALYFLPFHAAASDGVLPGLDPAEPPLALVRVPSPAAAAALISSAPSRALGLADRDWAVRLPGLPRIPRIKAFLAALAERGGTDLWLCLPQLNRSALGWRWRVPGVAGATKFLESQGLDASRAHLLIEEGTDDSALVILAADAETVAALRNGGKSHGEREWSRRFAAFADADRNSPGLWLDPQPFFGLAGVAMGVDFRALLASVGAELPFGLELWLTPRNDGTSVDLRISGLFRRGAFTGSRPDARRAAGFSRKPSIRLDVNAAGLREIAAGLPLPPGVDPRRLTPECVSFGLSAEPDGGWRWAATGDLGREGSAREDFLRLGEWLKLLASDPNGGLVVETSDDGKEQCTIRLESGATRLLASLKTTTDGGEEIGLTNGGEDDLPHPASASGQSADSVGAAWDIRLDEASREAVIAALSRPGALPLTLHPDAWRTLVGEREKGGIALEGGDLALESPHGAVLWLAPVAITLAAAWRPDADDLAAARLRFLLEAFRQTRFRQAGPDALSPAPPATGFADLGFDDPSGSTWLDNALPPFPGLGRPNSEAVARIARERDVDGYSYSLQRGGDWAIVARPARSGLPVLRVDAEGRMTELPPNGDWRPRRNILADWIADAW